MVTLCVCLITFETNAKQMRMQLVNINKCLASGPIYMGSLFLFLPLSLSRLPLLLSARLHQVVQVRQEVTALSHGQYIRRKDCGIELGECANCQLPMFLIQSKKQKARYC